jgi:DNA-binding CsgD family transcriptional regulator/tetratricopeptide (TPR) repeat protein
MAMTPREAQNVAMIERVSSPVFVGRRRELARVEAALARAGDAPGAAGPDLEAASPAEHRLFLVGGEAGVGKSRFVHELARRARGAGIMPVEGGCLPAGADGLPFGPIVETLRAVGREIGDDELLALLGPGHFELSRLMPHLGTRPDEGRLDGYAQTRLFDSVLHLLERLAARRPLLFIVEDLHWADPSTLDLLEFLGRNVRATPLVIVGTFRTDDAVPGHRLVRWLAEQTRAGRSVRMDLEPFARSEVREQVGAILGGPPDIAVLDALTARTQGNAFYVEELLASGPFDDTLPATLREVLLARIAGLSEPTQRFLRAASVSGSQFRPDLTAAVLGISRLAADRALREAVAHHILRPIETASAERFAFRHALVQESLYGDLLPADRRRMHATLAVLVAEQSVDDPFRAAEIANHLQAADAAPRAFDAWIEAGLVAEQLGAFAQALVDFEHALDLWDRVPGADRRTSLDRVEVLRRAALLAEGTAPWRKQPIAYIRAAIERVDPAADPVRLGQLYERLGQYRWYGADGSPLDAYQEALRLIPEQPPSAARAEALAGLGRYMAQMAPDPSEAIKVCEAALKVAAEAGAHHVETRALTPMGMALVHAGRVDDGMTAFARSRAIATDLNDAHELANCLSWHTAALYEAGRFEECVAAGRESESFAEQHGLGARWGTNSIFWMCEALVASGRWEEAAEALARVERYQLSPDSELVLETKLMLLDAVRGALDRARERVPRVQQLARSPSFELTAPALAEVALWSGRPRAAHELLQARIHEIDGRDHRVRRVGWLLSLTLRALADVVLLSAGDEGGRLDPRHARDVGADWLQRMRATHADVAAHRPYFLPLSTAYLLVCEAELARLEGRPDPDRWALAAARWDAIGMPYERGYALMRKGEALLAMRRHRARAAEVLIEARAAATGLGAGLLNEAIRSLAARANVTLGDDAAPARPEAKSAEAARRAEDPSTRVTPAPLRASRGRYDLTPREREVLRLVATGSSDGEIAEMLFISKKTASVHVAAIKAKLGSRSRVEIATDAIALGLAPVPAGQRAL